MMKKINKLFLGILLLPILAMVGCGGGGGGGSTAVKNFKSWSQVEPDSTYKLKAMTREIERGIQPISTDSELSFKNDSKGIWTDLTIKTPSSNVSFSTKDKDTIDYDSNPPLVTFGEPDVEYAIIANPYDLEWDYQTFGVWRSVQIDIQRDTLGFITAGLPTLANAIPIKGFATYEGSSIGTYNIYDSYYTNTYSNVKVVAEFEKQKLLFETRNTIDLLNGLSLASQLDMDGELFYQGTNSFSGLVNTAGDLSGTVDGRFYGPKAEELGGLFETRSQEAFYGGAFGAKIVPEP